MNVDTVKTKGLSDQQLKTLDFFMIQSGLQTPVEIINRLQVFDQLRAHKNNGNIFKVCITYVNVR